MQGRSSGKLFVRAIPGVKRRGWLLQFAGTPVGIMRVLSTPDLVHAVELIALDWVSSTPARMPIQAELERNIRLILPKSCNALICH